MVKYKPIELPDLATSSEPGWLNPDGMLYYDAWLYLRAGWDETCRTYEANPGSLYNAWHYLNDHPIYWQLRGGPPAGSMIPACARDLRDRIREAGIVSSLKDDLGGLVDDLEAVGTGRPKRGPRRHVRNLEHGYGFDSGGITITVERVNPADGKISADPALNTRTEFWYETGEWLWARNDQGVRVHAYKLDGGAPTYEQAVIDLARKVHHHYGNDRRQCMRESGRTRKRRNT